MDEQGLLAPGTNETVPLSQRIRAMDIVLGVVLPWGMLALDRFLFDGAASYLSPGSILGDWRPGVYVGTVLFTTVLCLRRAVGDARGTVAGILGAGAVFAIVVGVCFLPLVALGLLAPTLQSDAGVESDTGVDILSMLTCGGLPLLGLTPFLMVRPYVLGARAAWDASPAHSRLAASLGFVLALGLPFGAQFGAARASDHALLQVRSDDPAVRAQGVRTFRWLRQVRTLDDLLDAYRGATEAGERERLAESFRQITGARASVRKQAD